MPVDLADYTKPIRDALQAGKFACVYVVGTDGSNLSRPDLSRVGYALDLPATFRRLQKTSPIALAVHSALWVPDRAIATNIANAVACDMMPAKVQGGWYRADASTITQAVEIAGFRIHPGATMVWHDDLVKRWSRQVA